MNCTTNIYALRFLPGLFLLLGACSEPAEQTSSPGPKQPASKEAVSPKQAPLEEQTATADGPEDKVSAGLLPDAEAEEKVAPEPEPEPEAHKGPWLWITRSSAAIYSSPKANRKEKLGYAKRGGQVPILEGKVDGKGCSKGWYRVKSGGFICSLVGTTNEKSKDVKFRPTQPDIEAILPYKYARNAKNGTPLYRSLPTKKQTYKYEPYLAGAIAERESLEAERAADRKQMAEAGLSVEGAPSPKEAVNKDDESSDAPSPPPPAAADGVVAKNNETVEDDKAPVDPPPEPEVPLWEREERLNEVTLEELQKERDEVLAGRMMKGFYVAIDKTFKWDGRTWYKTTKGLIAPSDRFWQTTGSDFHGVELDGEEITLPIGWVFGGRKTAPTYSIDTESNKRKPVSSKKKFEAVELQYNYHRIGKIDYFQMKDGDWIRDRHIRMTTPGKRPEEVGPNERWIDVDISEQTLVVFEGDRPVYATLISSGKESRNKEKDHSTPRGMWRVREKHVASTMDGDGSAAGDLPYSIEDVPYIMYFHKSYATHGAFWHRNYGVQMSHGCVNLAPLDAKWIFFYAEPRLPEGFHGNWSSAERPGSMVVVHD